MAAEEDAGIDSVMTTSQLSDLGSGTASSRRSAGAPGVCSAIASALETAIPAVTCSAGTSGVGSVRGLVKAPARLSVRCSAKLSVISSVTDCPTGSGRGCKVASGGGVVIDLI